CASSCHLPRTAGAGRMPIEWPLTLAPSAASGVDVGAIPRLTKSTLLYSLVSTGDKIRGRLQQMGRSHNYTSCMSLVDAHRSRTCVLHQGEHNCRRGVFVAHTGCPVAAFCCKHRNRNHLTLPCRRTVRSLPLPQTKKQTRNP